MVSSPAPADGPSLIFIEGCVTAIGIAVAFCWPRLGSEWFARIERAMSSLARRKATSVAVVGAASLLVRLALLPLCPMPRPVSTGEFSFLLAADTFASGRLTNPTPAMWKHFETVHVTMKPTYMSMYFPGQGLVLAAAKVVTGHPWYGVLVMTALMCAAVCWMLQAWLPPTWALLGGALIVLRLGLFSYFVNSYSGAGSTAALGGALVLGALPRLMKKARLQDGILLAAGVIILGLCRPYDALLVCLPVLFVLVRWALTGSNRPTRAAMLRATAIPLVLIVAAGAWMGYYDDRAFGSPLTLSYTVDRVEYATAPYFIWQHQRAAPIYRHPLMRDFYQVELDSYEKIHSLSGFVPQTLLKAARGLVFYAGLVLLVPLIMFWRVLLDRRIRFLVLCVAILMAGQLIEVFFVSHYAAAFTAAFYAIGLQAMRHLRLWCPDGDRSRPVGMAIVRMMVSICVLLAGARAFAGPLHLALPVWPSWHADEWYGTTGQTGTGRALIEENLEHLPGKQLAIVRYVPGHNPAIEWIYNAADIDRSKVIWAWDMGEAGNRELVDYYKDRTVWLVQPDLYPATISTYAEREPAVQPPAAQPAN